MKSKFEYVLIGVTITMLTLAGIFTLVITQAQADDSSVQSVATAVLPEYIENKSTSVNEG